MTSTVRLTATECSTTDGAFLHIGEPENVVVDHDTCLSKRTDHLGLQGDERIRFYQ